MAVGRKKKMMVYRKISTVDNYGGSSIVWEKYKSLSGRVATHKGSGNPSISEQFVHDKETPKGRIQVYSSFDKDIVITDRISLDFDMYEIKSIENVNSSRSEMRILMDIL